MRLPHLVWIALALLMLGLTGVSSPAAHAQSARHIEPALTFETRTPAAGKSVTVAIRMQPEAGWHGYWSNPGEAGLPVEARWEAPAGVTFSPLRHPAPSLLNVQGIASYVHEGAFTLLAHMQVPDDLPKGSALPISVSLNWLVCSDTLCVPESAVLSAKLAVGDGARDVAGTRVVAAAQRALPRPLRDATFMRAGDDWIFSLPASLGETVRLFPANDGWFAAAARQSISRDGDRLLLRIRASGDERTGQFHGVAKAGTSSFDVSASPAMFDPASDVPEPGPAIEQEEAEGATQDVVPGVPDADETGTSGEEPSESQGISGKVLGTALLGALVGGLLLNLMPCVFPILSLKALSIAKSGSDPRAARIEGIGYAGGAIVTALLLGSLLIGLRAIGMEIGWSFQLQSPGVILVLLILTGAIALNLAGLFELAIPSFASPGGRRGGLLGGFSTGALAAFIAMPCSGPFMAGALGAALVLPAPVALGVFAMLGLGMALPFLAIAFIPAVQRRLPKPGMWMDTLRKVLSLPMFITALGLAWLLGRQTGVDGMAAGLAMALFFAVALWWFGLRQRLGRRPWVVLVPPTAALVALLAVGLPQDASVEKAAAKHPFAAQHEPFSSDRLAQLRDAGTPVFVDFTADWCLVCKVNERVAINTETAQDAFAQAGVVTLTGDWTRQDPEITKFLARHGRNSIPFYQFYAPGQPAEILPQILTPQLLAGKAEELGAASSRLRR